MECKGCSFGIEMCHHRSCFGTPEEFESIILSGFADKLRIETVMPVTNGLDQMVEDGIIPADFRNRTDFFTGMLVRLYEDVIVKPMKELNPRDYPVEYIAGGNINDVDHYLHPDQDVTGRCNLLDENNLCTVHHIKPEMGREACCDKSKETVKENSHYFDLWDSDKGREVVELFKQTLNLGVNPHFVETDINVEK